MDFNGFSFTQLFQPQILNQLDQQFLNFLRQQQTECAEQLLAYRQQEHTFSALEVSTLLLVCAPILERFIAQMFQIESEVTAARAQAQTHESIFAFKKWFVLRRARRRLSKEQPTASFAQLDAWLTQALATESTPDREYAVAAFSQQLLTDKTRYANEIEQLTQWCMAALTTVEGQAAVHNWASFRLPHHLDHQQLVPIVGNSEQGFTAPAEQRRHRQGFQLTDPGMSARQVHSELHYCLECHQQEGDFCSKGFPQKRTEPQQGFKLDPLGNILTGCPLDEKISEMHQLKRQGYTIAALALMMIDNPLCPVTGHRICNDCMKSCIYQRQAPVNIPQIETRILLDVLALPWGVEIYDLLTRWHPLRPQQWVAKPYNGLKVLIAGQGPAGFSLAHHLLMEGFAVVGIDGLKIEPLPEAWLQHPIRDYATLTESLAERVVYGFGGVAEYGITVRWDKNFLKLIHLSLLRRPYYQLMGSVRFGGTLTVADAWQLGFDHVSIAVGAGLPKALAIPGSLAPGMRQAADFLMALQLTGAAKSNSLTNMQVRLPAVIIGGGLTAIDTATEVQAYYLVQIEKFLQRYEQLCEVWGEARVRAHFEAQSLEVLSEWLSHARQLRAARQQAKAQGHAVDIHSLIHQWGGVTIVYRRSLQESPAYIRNHEEVAKALEEGIFYRPGLEPQSVQLDDFGHVQALVCTQRQRAPDGQWQSTEHTVRLAARAIFVATGAQPNIAYEFEHRGHFQRQGFQYQPHEFRDGQLQPLAFAAHSKAAELGVFTSYAQNGHYVSFIGDTHATFQGSVVKALASGKRTYPQIVALFAKQMHAQGDEEAYLNFRTQIQEQLSSRVVQVQRHSPSAIEVQLKSPLAARKFQPGQFFRLQNFETQAPLLGNTRLQTEALAMRCAAVAPETGLISLMVLEQGSSSRLCALFRPGMPLALMGPTGVRSSIPKSGNETILVIGGRLAAANICTLGPAWRQAGNRVLLFSSWPTADELFLQSQLEAATDMIVWMTTQGKPITPNRPQDLSVQGDLIETLLAYAQNHELSTSAAIPLSAVDRVWVTGSNALVRAFQETRKTRLHQYWSPTVTFTASVHGPMQCMLKGVCAQCLQWQIDPETGKRTKAVFACSWQDQPLDMIDLNNVDERLRQNRVQETLTDLWLDYILARYGKPMSEAEQMAEF